VALRLLVEAMRKFLRLACLLPGLAAGHLEAAPLAAQANRTSPQDLEVTTVGTDGTVSKPVYYTYEELETLAQTTATTDKDPETLKSATYTGVPVNDLFAAFGAKAEDSVMTMTCYDKYQQFYDSDYDAKHQPLFLLKFNGLKPDQWPKSDQDTPQGPYSVVYAKFVPAETIYGYVQPERIPYGVISARIYPRAMFFNLFQPKSNADDPEVQKGERIAMGSCISCHNIGDAGGAVAGRPWMILALYAATNSDHFRNYIVAPQKIDPSSKMPAHPTFDAKTLDALQAYFKTMAPQ
jgi:mono/diheme cytochrome c family protein